jgi:hypothetical protein
MMADMGTREMADRGAVVMRLVVLHVPGCPNAPALAARVAELVAGRARVEQRVVHDDREAADLGMRGSPTLLVDGIDPFARADQPPSLSCRLYRDEAGALAGAPSLAQLREVLFAA